jgi:probable phosphoglycerate mutase
VALASLVGLPSESWQVVRVPPASLSVVRLWPDAVELVVAGLPSELAEQAEAPLTLF